MKMKIVLASLAVGVLCAAQSVLAHHAFAAEYDVDKPLTLTGTLAKLDWVHPHSWIYMDVKQPNGTVQRWQIEASGPNAMIRGGLKKTDFVSGMSFSVKGYQGKKVPTLLNGRTLVLADGRSFYIGSVGGPNDGADKINK
jgi:hypothetical protein